MPRVWSRSMQWSCVPQENGAVCCVQDHLDESPELARLVMDRTPSMMIAGAAADRPICAPPARPRGKGAARPLRSRGLVRGVAPAESAPTVPNRASDPMTVVRTLPGPSSPRASGPDSEDRWRYHDTIGVLARTSDGRLAGACSTSGMPFQAPGSGWGLLQ